MINKVLVVGGYGVVGTELVKTLLSLKYQVVAGGRSKNKGAALLEQLAHENLEFAQFDFTQPDYDLDKVSVVIMCSTAENAEFARYCVEQGCHYIDISAEDRYLQQLESLQHEATEQGVKVLVSVGLAPGLSNMLARQVRGKGVEQSIYILLGSGEKHGAQALEWTLYNMLKWDNAQPSRHIDFEHGIGRRLALHYNFSDQYSLKRRSNIQAATFLSLTSSMMMRFIQLARRWPALGKAFSNPRLAHWMTNLSSSGHLQ